MPKIETSTWSLHWRITESAGLMIYLADYKGKRVLWDASLPYITVTHQQRDLEVEADSEHSSSAEHGSLWTPLGERTLIGSIRQQNFEGGFELSAVFRSGVYRYTQLWRFHDDGRIAPLLEIHPGGLHEGHTYHPHWRFDFDLTTTHSDVIEYSDGTSWNRVSEEGWLPKAGQDQKDRGVWRQCDPKTRKKVTLRPYELEDGELFAIRYREGRSAPFTPRTNPGSHPFPADYVGSGSLDGADVALWYVAHIHYNASFPFIAGPWLQVSL